MPEERITLFGAKDLVFASSTTSPSPFNGYALPEELKRVAVIDLDVHQGDGTAQIFQDEPDVLTLSVHCEVNFPFRKQQSKIDVALPEGTGDEEYLQAAATKCCHEFLRSNPRNRLLSSPA